MKNLKFLVLFAALFAACSSNNSNEEPLTIGFMSSINAIPYIVSQQNGYLADNVELMFFRDSAERDAAAQAGLLHGVMTDMLAYFLFLEGGGNQIGISATQGRFGIATNNDEVQTPRDLEGKSVGSQTNSIVEVFLDIFVQEDGGDPSLVTQELIPPTPLRLEALRERRIDAAMLSEPFLSSITQEPGGRVLAASEAPFTLVMVEAQVFESRRDELAALYTAIDQAIDFIENTPLEDFLPAAVEALGLGDSVTADTLPTFLRYSLPDEQSFNFVQQWMRDDGRIQGTYNYSEFMRRVK